MWKVIEEYIPLTLRRWQAMIVGGFGIAGLIAHVAGYELPNMPLWSWLVIIFFGFSIAQFLAYKKLSNRFTKQVITPNQVEDILTNIADLRLAGEQIRMAGVKLANANEMSTWRNQIVGWRKCVKREIEKLSRSEAKNFYAGYIVDTKDFAKIALCDDHKMLLGAITLDIEKIQKLLERYSPRNLAERISSEK